MSREQEESQNISRYQTNVLDALEQPVISAAAMRDQAERNWADEPSTKAVVLKMYQDDSVYYTPNQYARNDMGATGWNPEDASMVFSGVTSTPNFLGVELRDAESQESMIANRQYATNQLLQIIAAHQKDGQYAQSEMQSQSEYDARLEEGGQPEMYGFKSLGGVNTPTQSEGQNLQATRVTDLLRAGIQPGSGIETGGVMSNTGMASQAARLLMHPFSMQGMKEFHRIREGGGKYAYANDYYEKGASKEDGSSPDLRDKEGYPNYSSDSAFSPMGAMKRMEDPKYPVGYGYQALSATDQPVDMAMRGFEGLELEKAIRTLRTDGRRGIAPDGVDKEEYENLVNREKKSEQAADSYASALYAGLTGGGYLSPGASAIANAPNEILRSPDNAVVNAAQVAIPFGGAAYTGFKSGARAAIPTFKKLAKATAKNLTGDFIDEGLVEPAAIGAGITGMWEPEKTNAMMGDMKGEDVTYNAFQGAESKRQVELDKILQRFKKLTE
jgi:hypothetical protein